MHVQTERMLKRTRDFGVAIVRFSRLLPKDSAGFIFAKQIIRSGTSIGANYSEAQRARTKNEFTSKLAISLQEADETKCWLEVLLGSEIVPSEMIEELSVEVDEISAILVRSIRSAKRKT